MCARSKPRTPNSKRSVEKKSEREKSLQKYKNRAKKQRRRTLEEKDRNMAAMCGAKPRLFESVLIVSLEPSLGCGEAAIMKPTVSYRFPEDQAGADVSPELFFPDYTHAQKTRFCREEFVLALTDEAGKRKNAYCHKFLPPEYEKVGGYPAVLVVISPIRNDIFYLDVARTIRKYLEKSYDHLTSFLTSIVRHNYPQNRGASLVVVEKSSSGRPNRFEIFNHGTILGRTDCSKVIERISPEVTACVIAALLGEQRVLLAERTVCMASKLVQVMEALIQPFCWPHVFIPAVPDNLLDLCHNPTPYLMGILRNNLAPIHDLIVADQHNKNELDQMDFVFIDASNGLINPPPEPFLSDGDVAAWKLETALSFCERLGMPRKACMALITGFRNAISSGTGSAADLRVETVMLSWYASLFGHYKTVCCQCDWGGALFKQRLVEMQPDKSVRPYLSYLVETVMFHEWIMKRTSKEILPPDPLPGSEEYLNRRIDKLYAAGVNSFATKPLAKMFNKVTNVLRAKK
ncbi:unnamed protein product [Heligmosomoides polygyrus]|uniref:UDENN domain-containing protein n=1 Tax=Heligmosomoides polygyrus TaxID=6339 RepID=A0A3P7YQ40_HELPZ|nr:unnamed protein product [Heligmosomoides polygyrus]